MLCRFVYDLSVFLLFKQKTAYEMRISDWSSDVCSSDLLLSMYEPCFGFACQAVDPQGRAGSGNAAGKRKQEGAAIRHQVWLEHIGHYPSSRVSSSAKEIGRASCRERVCQYV